MVGPTWHVAYRDDCKFACSISCSYCSLFSIVKLLNQKKERKLLEKNIRKIPFYRFQLTVNGVLKKLANGIF